MESILSNNKRNQYYLYRRLLSDAINEKLQVKKNLKVIIM